jgi:hypothetical protein
MKPMETDVRFAPAAHRRGAGLLETMATRQFKLIAEVSPDRVFYSINYSPRLKNLGGQSGVAYPGGSLFSLSYEQLQALGSGTHTVEADEKVRSREGLRSPLTDDEQLVEGVRLALFVEKAGGGLPNEVICSVILGFNSRTAEQVVKLLNKEHLQELIRYAQSIPRSRHERDIGGFEIFSSGGSVKIPDENLVALSDYFANGSF